MQPHTPAICTSILELRQLRREWAKQDQIVGFIPTMGALHSGHLSLCKEAIKECDKVIVSIFVNPSQFAPTEDLELYPRTLDRDIELLAQLHSKGSGVDVVLVPKINEIYPSGISLQVSEQLGAFVCLNGLSHQMEGAIRPHFFRGVSTILTKLFNITQPAITYMGQKDAQQCVVVKRLVKDLLFPGIIKIIATHRHEDGLAESSRNAYLTPRERALAPVLYNALCFARDESIQRGIISPNEIMALARNFIHGVEQSSDGIVRLEYISLNHPVTLDALFEHSDFSVTGAIFSGAVLIGCGRVTRIIDNILLGFDLDAWNEPGHILEESLN